MEKFMGAVKTNQIGLSGTSFWREFPLPAVGADRGRKSDDLRGIRDGMRSPAQGLAGQYAGHTKPIPQTP
jgi:hypothetical protein